MKWLLFFLMSFAIVFGISGQENNVYTENRFPRKNNLYLQNVLFLPAVYYDRIIPVSEHSAIVPRIGLAYYDEIVTAIEGSYIIGNGKHFAEIGAGIWAFELPALTANYRYSGKKGLLLKAGFQYIPGEEAFPSLGIGYSF